MDNRDRKVKYKFFEKTMASELVVMKNAAMADDAKQAILSQEVRRRMANTCEGRAGKQGMRS